MCLPSLRQSIQNPGRGFLDHPSVWIFHFLQAFWYRLLVDVNVWEFKKNVGAAGRQAQLDFLKTEWRV